MRTLLIGVRGRRRVGAAIAVCLGLGAAGCADEALAPRSAPAASPVTTDRASYQLSTYSHAGLTYFSFHGVATFTNRSNTTLYLPPVCEDGGGPVISLVRLDGTPIGLQEFICDSVLLIPPAPPIVVKPGESRTFQFGFATYAKDSLAVAEIPLITGPFRVAFVVDQIVAGKVGMQPVPLAYRQSDTVMVSLP
jgi:hypothetical protein